MTQGRPREENQDTPMNQEEMDPVYGGGLQGFMHFLTGKQGLFDPWPSSVNTEKQIQGQENPEGNEPESVENVGELKKTDEGNGTGIKT